MKHILITLLITFCMNPVSAQFLEGKKNLQAFDGYFTFYYAEDEGSIYLEVDKVDEEFLYVRSLRTGLGSNDIGLDRGQFGDQAVVKFLKSGNKLLLLQPNLKFRANSDNKLERKSISEAFAKSVLFGFPIKEEKEGSYVIDFTPFLMRDAHNVAGRLKSQKQGNYKLDKTRNTVWMERTKAFPKNVEFEALLTFIGEPTGDNIRSVSPDAQSISVIQHHSFVELPDDNYEPREFDPRCGSFSMDFMDYASRIHEPIKKKYITRHRIEKKNKASAKSEAVEPIIYYLDPGTPEPVRSALIEGASWWNQAFEDIGYNNAFQVKLLPEEADPMDVRYNVIQWVHRSTRGWSYGRSVIDPRTGEIIKGHVSLGSLRIRQDFMIAQALMNKPFKDRDDNHDTMMEMALARIRQLSAHEVGHTLGFAHNFAASTNKRTSVMDYPHPTLSLKKGEVDFSNAYATGIGVWDKITVAYSYSDIPNSTSEKDYLNGILEGAFANGLRYISDSDARAKGGAHAKAHLWDNGANASDELQNVLDLRDVAMSNFSKDNIRTGEPYTVLEDVFVPLYFYHRYQTEAAVKLVGGMEYDYLVKGYNGIEHKYLPKKDQENALNAVLNTLGTDILAIPEDKLKLFPPRAYGYGRSRESFSSKQGVSFDALGAAATASDLTLNLLLHCERANRLIQQKALEPFNLGLDDVLEELTKSTFNGDAKSEYHNEIQRIVQFRTLQHLMKLALNKNAFPQVKGIVNETINEIEVKLRKNSDTFSKEMVRNITSYKDDPEEFITIWAPKIPDGSPIGSYQCLSN
ncbi:MAG: DUF5117 domain-containing protein [Flavobacteriaceae bacterium]|nr:DUF5117 domain-containing protein [Flavobacteriaceae bacterium]